MKDSKEALERLLNSPTPKMRGGSYLDIKIIESIKQDLDKLEKVEKDLKQTKSNFKNSQTHSRNCYKKLLDKYMGLEKENTKLKKVIESLKDKIELPLENDFDVVNKDDIHLYRLRTKCLINEEEYELLKEVL